MREILLSRRGYALILMILAATALPIRAGLVTPGNTISISGTTEAARPELAGVVLQDNLIPFTMTNSSTSGTVSGTVQDRVVQESASGTLDFYYRVFLDANSSPQVQAVRTSGFQGFSTDVDFRLDGVGSVGPSSVQDFGPPNLGNLNFLFSAPGVGPGESSYFMFIKTNATHYNQSGLTDLTVDAGLGDAGLSTQFATFQPVAVPTPSALSASAVLFGLIALARFGRRWIGA